MIRNELYTKYLSEINQLAKILDDVLNKLPGCNKETMEESEIRYLIYKAAEKLNDCSRAINYFSKTTKEGKLIVNPNGRFEIAFNNGGNSYSLSCGSSIEVYLKADENRDEAWYRSRVEYNDGYYFYGYGNPKLYTGMKVRQRVEE